MRREGFRVRRAWMAALVCGVWLGGCKKPEPAEPAPAVAATPSAVTATASAAPDAGPTAGGTDAGTAAAEADVPQPFRYKDVKLSHDGTYVQATYTLENHGRQRARGETCLWLHDKDGLFIHKVTLGPISLKGGESDVFEDRTWLKADLWKQTSTVQLYAGGNCFRELEQALSAPRRLDLNGRPPVEEVPEPRPQASPVPGTQLFVLEDVSLVQAEPSDAVSVTFTVKNKSQDRLASRLCVRLYDGSGSGSACGFLDEGEPDDINLAPGASVTRTEQLTLTDDKRWDSAVLVKMFASQYGCSDKEHEFLSNVVELPKPAGIHAPREPEEIPEPSADAEEDEAAEAEDGEPVAAPSDESIEAGDTSDSE